MFRDRKGGIDAPSASKAAHRLSYALFLGCVHCQGPSDTLDGGAPGVGDDAGDDAGDDGDGDAPLVDLPQLPAERRRDAYGAGTRLAPIVWAHDGVVLDQGAMDQFTASPSQQDVRTLLEPWFDHQLQIGCAFGLGVEDRCLPRRTYEVDASGDANLGDFADPACTQRVLASDLSLTVPYARRIDADTGEVLGVSRLGEPQEELYYRLSGGQCVGWAQGQWQRVQEDVPLEAFVHASVEIETERTGRMVPMTMRTDDGAWKHVDVWDTQIQSRVDPSDEVDNTLRWIPSVSSASTGVDSWDAPPVFGADTIVTHQRAYGASDCETQPMLEVYTNRGQWSLQREAGSLLDQVARIGASASGSPTYRRLSSGECALASPTCSACFHIAQQYPISHFAVVEGTTTYRGRLGRFDWTSSAGDVLHVPDPDRWWDSDLDTSCRRSFSSFDPGGNFYCFPFPGTHTVYTDVDCEIRLGELYEGLTERPPGFIGTSPSLTELRRVTWIAVDLNEPLYRIDCTSGCTCVPHDIRGPEAYYYDGLAEELDPGVLARFEREILPPR